MSFRKKDAQASSEALALYSLSMSLVNVSKHSQVNLLADSVFCSALPYICRVKLKLGDSESLSDVLSYENTSI